MSARWVLVTRPDDELESFRAALAPAGFSVVPYPVLRQVAWDDRDGWRRLDDTGSRLHATCFTSPRAPAPFRAAAETRGRTDLAALPATAVGAATAQSASSCGFSVVAVGGSGGRDLAGLIAGRVPRAAAVLHPCAREHRGELEDALARHDIEVVTLIVYAMDLAPAASLPVLPASPPAAVVLTSPRAAEAYSAACGSRFAAAPHLVMGITSAARARELGIEAVTLRRPSPTAIVEELCRTRL